MNSKLKTFDPTFSLSLQMGDFKGADPLNLLKIFGRAFYKKLVGVSGAKPLTIYPKVSINVCISIILEDIMKKSNSLRAWTDINALLRTHKLINLGLVAVCILQMFIIGWMYAADPIVVIREGNKQQYHTGQRASLPISEAAVEEFVRKFLRIRYEWDKLDPQEKRQSLAPITTSGLQEKLFKLLMHLKNKEFQSKETSQAIVNIKISVTKEKVVASFDKLLRLEGVPIPVPTTLSLHIIQGTPNTWNPIGLLVNGVIEHQEK